jgi:hypothetical protein
MDIPKPKKTSGTLMQMLAEDRRYQIEERNTQVRKQVQRLKISVDGSRINGKKCAVLDTMLDPKENAFGLLSPI